MNGSRDPEGCAEYKLLMMGFIDGELPPEEAARFKEHVYACPNCARELTAYRKLADLTEAIRLKEPADHEWDRIRRAVLYRVERGAGWILAVAGFLLVGAYAVYELLADWEAPFVLRLGTGALLAGLGILLFSVFRQRRRIRRYERYDAVNR